MRFILPKFFFNCERWKWNDDLRIYVSTHGHVKDEHKKNVAAKINGNGYFVVRVNDRFYTIHRLVLMTWRPLPNDGTPMTVDHLDSNRRNNHLENLEWVSQEENLRRANEIFTNDKDAMCEICKNFQPISTKNLGALVTWEELEKRYGLCRNPDKSFPEGFSERLKEIYMSGDVKIYKGTSPTEITHAALMKAISSQPNMDLVIDRYLKCSINRVSKYLGWKPWMRWSK